MHHDHAARPRSERSFQRVKIDLPAVVVDERVTCDFHVVQVREKFKKGITGCGDQDFVSRIAKHSERE